MSMIRSRRRVPLLVITLATVLGLAACGGGNNSAKTQSGTNDLGSAKIVLGGKVITWAPAYVAVCQGFFKNHGLNVELDVSPQGTTAAIGALVAGNVLSAMTGAPAAVAPVRQGAPVQMLFNASQGYSVQVVASNDTLKRKGVTKNSSLSDRVHALQGEKVAILNPGDSIDQLLRYVLPKYGMNPDKDITMVALNNYSSMFAAMRKNTIGVLAGSPPNGNQAESQGIGKILFTGNEFPGLAKYPYLVGSANTGDISKHPQRVKALVAGIADAMKLLRKDPAAGKPCLRKAFPDLDQATFDSSYAYAVSTVPDSPLITPENFQALSDFADASGKPLGVSYDKAVAANIVKQAIGG